MRKKALGLLALAFIGAMTSLATSAALGDKKRQPANRQKRSVPVAQNPAPTDSQPAPTPIAGGIPARDEIDPPHVVASSGMSRMQVEMVGRTLHIATRASIMDRRPGMSYVWSVRIFDGKTRKVLWRRSYDDQVFTVPPGVRVNPTFEDVLPLPTRPGSYSVQLTAYQVPPGMSLDRLNDESLAEGFVAFQGSEKFDIKK